MAYPKEARDALIDYCNEGHSVREAQGKFGVSKSSASLWLRAANGCKRKTSSHPARYPERTVRLAIGLAYGNHGSALTEVAHMLGVSAPSICIWKRRCVDGGIMEMPDIAPDEASAAAGAGLEGMDEGRPRGLVRERGPENAALEETAEASEVAGIDGLANAGRALAVDALAPRFGIAAALRAMRMASSSYYYIKSRRKTADRYAEARIAIVEEFEAANRRRGYRWIRMRLRMCSVKHF